MSGWRSREIHSFRCAIAGIYAALRGERHMQFHFAAAIAVVAAGFWLQVGREDWLWLSAAIAVVWVAELFNTAIERVVDMASPGMHPLAKAAKDTAAGAVLVTSLFAVIVGVIVLGPPLWDTFRK
ncbi:diacylglycerol kinase family protein [Cohnella endophytica]|uniref:Diacylglycerol kinase family protein n=1 Tax=Cohnella endophytica TaxID=2419778 RepID=A0A494Y1H0_9BACL|nr:diacylglycerol kinase family protein [Cohnella endophytica]RKP55223.1 diacylglycerol kinase family protein [Cohnella endophytica]